MNMYLNSRIVWRST